MPTYIGGFRIDAVLSRDTTSDADITDHNVETGGDMTDHVRIKPKIINMECVVSDTPMPGTKPTFDNDIATPYDADDVIPSESARTFLESLQLARQPIVLSESWVRADGSQGSRTFDSMLIQNITENETVDTGDAYKFRATFKQVKQITNDRTVVRVALPRHKKKTDRGNKSTEEGHPPEKAKDYGSTLQGLFSGDDNYTGIDKGLDAISGHFKGGGH